jgi:hypothetical protein
MRLIGCGVAFVAAVAWIAPASAWTEYKYEDLGVAKEFPAEPKVATGTYKTVVAGAAPSHIFTVDEPDSKYSMIVVDLMDKVDSGSTIQGECVAMAEEAGKATVANMPARVEPGKAAIYGRIVSEDMKDGSRQLTECFYTKGRLYKIAATILPSNSDFPNSAEGVRFINSLRFNMKDESLEPPADGKPIGGKQKAGAGGGE